MRGLIVKGLQTQGAVVLCLLGLGWLLSYAVRRRELRERRRRGNVPHAQQTARSWPGVTVILPVKGCRRHSISNWRSHISLKYSGSIEFLFVVDSQADPSYGSLSDLAVTMRSRGSRVRVIIAPQARTCSQKIANLGAGIKEASPGHEWALCLDDDVLVYESFLEDLVRDMQQKPTASMATGYPFDIPEKDASIFTYCCLAYHLPLSVAFAVRQRTMFVWGGCMLLPLHDLRADRHGILAAWSQGGYSDDLTVASKCAEHQLQILCPTYAVLPQWLEPCSAGQFWNYLRRQLYVMDTYCNAHNRALNYTMLALHGYLSWAFVLPLVMTIAEVFAAVLRLTTRAKSQGAARECATASISLPALLYLAAFAFAHVCLRLLTGANLKLLHQMSFQEQLPTSAGHFVWWKLWGGFCLANALLPCCALYTCLHQRICWSGVTYTKLGGCIVSVEHPEKHKGSSCAS